MPIRIRPSTVATGAVRASGAPPGRSRPARRLLALALTAALVTPLGAAPSAAEPAPLVCAGVPAPGGVLDEQVVSDRRVRGGIVVPEGGSCRLHRVTVEGDVRVDPQGWLMVERSAVLGSVHVRGSMAVSRATFHGDVHVDAPDLPRVWAAYLEGGSATFLGRVHGRGAVDLYGVHVVGSFNVTAVALDMRLEDSRFDGWVNVPAAPGIGVGIRWSDLRSGLTIKRGTGHDVCGTDVAGDLVLRDVRGYVAVGAFPAGHGSCPAWGSVGPPPGHPRAGEDPPEQMRTTVGGTLRVVGDGTDLHLHHVHVAGDLLCPDRGVTAGLVTAGGTRTGGCR
ncbi:hypothetical protein [Cellulomonas oligotrophica]|uniref:Lipoprotein n=1 Tax=Cellulomonas oligotrophica TaxID=931536 RepID=A0A7Y9FF36_9CELL|nr:hypothetical protein [Cellulomonas oligotrophica]NYD85978.1 hypothetical protein [Cellulomonas oligotrophica]GIG31014.1 hypothetical protein Col01nite_01730 [Cellulomonas oligotrophica]